MWRGTLSSQRLARRHWISKLLGSGLKSDCKLEPPRIFLTLSLPRAYHRSIKSEHLEGRAWASIFFLKLLKWFLCAIGVENSIGYRRGECHGMRKKCRHVWDISDSNLLCVISTHYREGGQKSYVIKERHDSCWLGVAREGKMYKQTTKKKKKKRKVESSVMPSVVEVQTVVVFLYCSLILHSPIKYL